jgi:hypothetical protein
MEQQGFPGYGIVRRVSLDRVVPRIALSSLLAVWFIWMGIGSVRARRWARALILVSSWLCLTYGILASVILLESIPHAFTRMVARGETSSSKIPAMWAEAIAFLATVSVVIPGLFILLYRGRDVQATCQSRDPQTRWTDKCPLPVLAISLVAAAEGLALFGTGISVWTYSHLRAISHGPLVAIADLLLAAVSIYAAWGLYQQSIKAWWASLLVACAHIEDTTRRDACYLQSVARFHGSVDLRDEVVERKPECLIRFAQERPEICEQIGSGPSSLSRRRCYDDAFEHRDSCTGVSDRLQRLECEARLANAPRAVSLVPPSRTARTWTTAGMLSPTQTVPCVLRSSNPNSDSSA